MKVRSQFNFSNDRNNFYNQLFGKVRVPTLTPPLAIISLSASHQHFRILSVSDQYLFLLLPTLFFWLFGEKLVAMFQSVRFCFQSVLYNELNGGCVDGKQLSAWWKGPAAEEKPFDPTDPKQNPLNPKGLKPCVSPSKYLQMPS